MKHSIEKLTEEPWLIEHIKNPSVEQMLAAVNKDGLCVNFLVLADIPIPDEVQWAAIKQFPWSIAYLSDVDEAKISYALDSEPCIIKVLKKSPDKFPITEQMKLDLMGAMPDLLEHVDNPSIEVLKRAVINKPEIYERFKGKIDFPASVKALAGLS